jgi:hypothetical protein
VCPCLRVDPADFDRVTITAPRNSRLPDGGGYPVSFYVVKDNKFGSLRQLRHLCQGLGHLADRRVLGGGEVADQLRGLASYTIPKVDVLVSAIMRSVANTQPQTTQDSVATNGLSLNANYDVSTAQVLAATGGPLPGGATFSEGFGTDGSTLSANSAISAISASRFTYGNPTSRKPTVQPFE